MARPPNSAESTGPRDDVVQVADAANPNGGDAAGKRGMAGADTTAAEVHAAAAETAGVAFARSEQGSGQSRGCREGDDDFA